MLTHAPESSVPSVAALDLAALTRDRVPAGQRELAHAMRTLVSRTEPEIASAIGAAPDATYLEPLLFSYFAHEEPPIGLPQLLFGSVGQSARPDAVEVCADECGRVYLPRVGSFFTTHPRAQLLLTWERASGRYALIGHELGRSGVGTRVPFHFEPERRVPGTRIELLTHISPLLAPCFVDTSGQRASAAIDPELGRRAREIGRALEWLRACALEYSTLLAQVTRQLCVFRAPDVNSFATIHAHGTAFFNTAVLDPLSPSAAVFFFDELVHQCGHIVFNALTVKRGDFLAIDPETPLRELAPDEASGRTVYDALHGLYTEHVMSRCMLALARSGLVDDPYQAHELHGRLSFIVHKHCVDLANLARPSVLTPLGRELYEAFRSACLSIVRARPDLLSLDMREQPYNFDYARFVARNPLRGDEPTRRT